MMGLIIWEFLRGTPKEQIFTPEFMRKHNYYPNPKPAPLEQIRKLFEDPSQLVLTDDFGYTLSAHGALNYALHALKNFDDFESGLVELISLGHDIDTTCAIYGAMYGAMKGASGLPKKLVEQVYSGPAIKLVAGALAELAIQPNSSLEEFKEIIKEGKYLVDFNPSRLDPKYWYLNPTDEMLKAKEKQSKGESTGLTCHFN